MSNKTVCIDEIKGCEGNCITMNDYRVAGPKPWGSGIVVKNWVAKVDDVITALRDNDVVKVVRCKECKWWKTNGCWYHQPGRCAEREPLDFCSDGERKDKDA